MDEILNKVFDKLRNYLSLNNYIESNYIEGKRNFVLIDEVQMCKEFERTINSLHAEEKYDIYITGSNAYLLSGELATLLSGRYIEIKMLPLSFKEYLSAFPDKKESRDRIFLEYMRNGGMPGNISLLENNLNDLDKYLDGIFSTVVYKDIMARNNITDKILLENIIKFIYDSIGSAISTKKISDTLTSKGMSTSNHTVENYITAFLESFLIYKATFSFSVL